MAVREPNLAVWLIDSLSSGLVAIDAAGSLTALNEAAQRILGGPGGDAADWLGRDFRAALAFRPELLGLLEDALDGRERPSRAELVLPANGEAPETTVGFTLLAIRDAQAQLRGVAIQFRDLAAYERDDERARLRDRLAALA
jgi:PAS domain-containing protein